MKKIFTGIGVGVVVLIILGVLLSSGEKEYEVPNTPNSITNNGSTEAVKKVTKADLLAQNDPTLKKIAYATADYVGQEFEVYALLEVSDYYNYKFADETKYYSFSIQDESLRDSFESTYVYIDKTDASLKPTELFDLALEDEILIKLSLSIPVEKYTEGSNAYFEITSWEVVE